MPNQGQIKRALVSGMACLLGLWVLTAGAQQNPQSTGPQPEATINVIAGDAVGLIAAINTANRNGQADTIVLAGGTYTYTTPDNYWYGPNALPAISSVITIEGSGSVIERSPSTTSNFWLFYVDGGLSGSCGTTANDASQGTCP